MHNTDDHYLVTLLEEQALKKSAFNRQLDLLNYPESSADKRHRLEYMKYLADRLMQIDGEVERTLLGITLDLDSWFMADGS